ncbi:MAG: hypothetical protein JRH07_11195 [Deltaproteobacteria bacterium]|nr:hypothetical protein [Deltaproteobacteria bacterium]MBW2122398.1 hypothetical protein [Deltaproteobacteria bacterium]
MAKRYGTRILTVFAVVTWCLGFFPDARAENRYNMVNDYRLYRYSGYRAKSQDDRTLLVKVIPGPQTKAETDSRGAPMKATDDEFWLYPVQETLERILYRELALSFLFRKLSREDERSDLVLEVLLGAFSGSMQRAGLVTRVIDGRVAFSVRLVQRSPRKILFEKQYDRQNTVKLKPVTRSGYLMARQVGRCLQEVVPLMLADLEKVLNRREAGRKPRNPPKRRKIKAKRQETLDLEPIGPK